MAEMPLSRQLREAGWKQGTLLPALAHSVVYLPSHPLTGIAKRTKTPAATIRVSGTEHAVATGIMRATDYHVVITQTCDILKSESEEPTVLAMRAYITDNQRILAPAAKNSARMFLLDPDRGLVVDGTVLTEIEKPVLAGLTPAPGAPNCVIERRFARWLGQRFSRFAFPDPIVGAIIKPLLDNLRQMQGVGDPDLTALDPVEQIRLAPTGGEPPYEVSLLFIIPQSGLPDGGIALARLVARVSSWFEPNEARLAQWDAAHLYEISVGDYLDYEQILLDEYTYQGQTIRGLEPRFDSLTRP
jgi:hypothetical protein